VRDQRVAANRELTTLIEIDAYIMALRRLGEALNRMRERGYVEDPRFRAALWVISDDLQACCPAALEARKAVVELNGVVMSMSEHVVRLIEKLGDDEESAIDDLQAEWSEDGQYSDPPPPCW
jgi:uncharacterized coiled-coil protein SlyX